MKEGLRFFHQRRPDGGRHGFGGVAVKSCGDLHGGIHIPGYHAQARPAVEGDLVETFTRHRDAQAAVAVAEIQTVQLRQQTGDQIGGVLARERDGVDKAVPGAGAVKLPLQTELLCQGGSFARGMSWAVSTTRCCASFSSAPSAVQAALPVK